MEGAPSGEAAPSAEAVPSDRERLRIRIEGSLIGSRPRTLVLSPSQLRGGLLAASALAALVISAVGSWSYLASQALKARGLAEEVARLDGERAQVARVQEDVAQMEAQFSRLRELFSEGVPLAEPLWLPPPGIGPTRTPSPTVLDAAPEPPSLWPLTERGFLSRGLIAVSDQDQQMAHPGIDLAIPSGSYFRAVGEGVVVERGEDPVYGLFVVVEHPLGYRSLYAHASVVVVEPGQAVRRGQVLGLTGSSGLSTAPHLHLEITRDGVHLDPLELLVRP